MTLVDQSLALVRRAARRIGKKPLADRCGMSDAILRRVHEADFNPTAGTLRALEKAAAEIEAAA